MKIQYDVTRDLFYLRLDDGKQQVINKRLSEDEEPEPIVYIRAVGVKQRNRLRIGREVIEL